MHLTHIVLVFHLLLASVLGRELIVQNRCCLADTECETLMYQDIFRKSTCGNPAMNIPCLDPMFLENKTYVLPNSVKFIMENAFVSGFRNCEYKNLNTFLEKPFRSTFNIECLLEVHGHLTVKIPKLVVDEIEKQDMTVSKREGPVSKRHMGNFGMLISLPFGFVMREEKYYLSFSGDRNYKYMPNDNGLSVNNLFSNTYNQINERKLRDYIHEETKKLSLAEEVTDKMIKFFEPYLMSHGKYYPASTFFTDVSEYAS